MKVYNAKFNLNLFLANEQVNLYFYYSYNNNTKYINLIEYISSLYPNYKICPCFSITNNKEIINNNDYLVKHMQNMQNMQNNVLNISNINFKNGCNCSSMIKQYYCKSKIEIIKQFEESIEENQKVKKMQEKTKKLLENSLNEKENQINELKKEKTNNQEQINSLKQQSKEEIEKLNVNKKLLETAINGDF